MRRSFGVLPASLSSYHGKQCRPPRLSDQRAVMVSPSTPRPSTTARQLTATLRARAAAILPGARLPLRMPFCAFILYRAQLSARPSAHTPVQRQREGWERVTRSRPLHQCRRPRHLVGGDAPAQRLVQERLTFGRCSSFICCGGWRLHGRGRPLLTTHTRPTPRPRAPCDVFFFSLVLSCR